MLFHRKSMNQESNLQSKNHPITEAVINYLSMDTSGALLVTGDWGCGKTYYFKNELFNEVSLKSSHIPIIVSLFGTTELKEIPERILYAYLDATGGESAPLGTIAKYAKNIASAVSSLATYVDVDKILGSRDWIYRILPNNILICFDDLERVADKFAINDILGIVNDLVENRKYKVILIANESFIGPDKLEFKEKVIEKTFRFLPDIVGIFSGLVDSHCDTAFSKFMSEEFVVSPITRNDTSVENCPLRSSLSNIRTLKFAIEHFYPVFSYYRKEQGEDVGELDFQTIKKLRSYWVFILAVSLEYRSNRISFEDSRDIENYCTIVDLGFDLNEKQSIGCAGEETEKAKKESTLAYSRQFYQRYFIELSEPPVYHHELYKNITGGVSINYEELDDYSSKKLGVEEKASYRLLSQFQYAYWTFTNDEISEKLQELLRFVRQGDFDDYISYVNVTIFLLKYQKLFDQEEEDIISSARQGISQYTQRIEVSIGVKSHIEMVSHHLSASVRPVCDYIINLIDKKLEDSLTAKSDEMSLLFQEDIEKLLRQILPQEYGGTPQYFDVPILKKINSGIVAKKMGDIQPKEAMCLCTLIRSRYINNPSPCKLNAELPFLESLREYIAKAINSDDKKLSTIILANDVQGELEKAINLLGNGG